MLELIQIGTNMAGENQQKHLSLSYAYKSVNYIPRGKQKQYKKSLGRHVHTWAPFPPLSRVWFTQ